MSIDSRLVLTDEIHASLREHLFPGDGLEAAAILVCTRHEGEHVKLLSKHLILVPHTECEQREANYISWPGRYLEQAIDLAENESLSIILVHSHPGGYFEFSEVDDKSDAKTIPSLVQGVEAIHGSAIMVPGGALRARLYDKQHHCTPIALVTVAGSDIKYWWGTASVSPQPVIAFTSGMTATLNKLSAVVIGVSGTGSIVAEQVARLGFGEVILIDHDQLEEKNLNRILNATLDQALAGQSKVEMFAQAINRIRRIPFAKPISTSILTREAVLAAAGADVIFSCVDTHQARMVADLISTTFLVPLFDVGVKIPTRKNAHGYSVIADVVGRIDYVRPGGASLGDRGVYTPQSLLAEYLQQVDPEAHRDQVERGYITGMQEEAPSVITLNMRAASACVSEFIARAFPFREEENGRYARTIFSLSGCEEDYFKEVNFATSVKLQLADGGKEPLLGLADLSESSAC
jgi:proteasome lid subunit RPN8/RPN11